MSTLQNKTALGTGASRGIGRATAAALAEAGAPSPRSLWPILAGSRISTGHHPCKWRTCGSDTGGPGNNGWRKFARQAGRESALGMQALTRIGKPEEVADVIVFLASDAARWVTRVSIPVDGGSKL